MGEAFKKVSNAKSFSGGTEADRCRRPAAGKKAAVDLERLSRSLFDSELSGGGGEEESVGAVLSRSMERDGRKAAFEPGVVE